MVSRSETHNSGVFRQGSVIFFLFLLWMAFHSCCDCEAQLFAKHTYGARKGRVKSVPPRAFNGGNGCGIMYMRSWGILNQNRGVVVWSYALKMTVTHILLLCPYACVLPALLLYLHIDTNLSPASTAQCSAQVQDINLLDYFPRSLPLSLYLLRNATLYFIICMNMVWLKDNSCIENQKPLTRWLC